ANQMDLLLIAFCFSDLGHSQIKEYKSISRCTGCLGHPPRGQSWRTFLRNHRGEIWACDFLQVTDLFFRSLFAFFIIKLQSRRVIHVGVTRLLSDNYSGSSPKEVSPLAVKVWGF